MDNFHFDMTSEGDLVEAMKIAARSCKAIAYSIRAAVEGQRWDADKYLKNPRDKNLLEWYHAPKSTRLVFYQYKSDRADVVALPFALDHTGMADFARRWLETADYGRQPDHDGDNGKGWRLYCEGWGHVDSDYAAFLAVSPRWACYGK